MHKSRFKTLLVHPYPVESEALGAWFRAQSDIEIVAISRHLPEPVLLPYDDIEMVIVFDHGLVNLPAQITHLKKSWPNLRLLVFRGDRSSSDIRDLICAGTDSLLDARSDAEEWYGAIRAISKHQAFFDQRIMQSLAQMSVTMQNFAPCTQLEHTLSIREMEILALVAREYSTSRIASELFISIKTVETHRRNLFQKLQVKNVVGLTKVALRMGVLS